MFLCFLTVFISHAKVLGLPETNIWWLEHIIYRVTYLGEVGVNFFFTLSGFLISYLLLNEKKQTNDIHVKQFYMRRILEIWPVYYWVIFLGIFLPMLFPFKNYQNQDDNILYFIFFLGNFQFDGQ